MAHPLHGRRVVITGAEGAFGRATTALLEAAGARVVGLDRAAPTRDDSAQCDITSRAEVEAAIGDAAARMGGIDVLVNNAGIGTAGPISAPFGEEERAVLDINAIACWTVTAAALPWLLAAPRGQVVNVASMLAVLPLPYIGAYSASKRAMCALSDSLRLEHHGALAVSTIYPGYVDTGIHTAPEARTGLSLAGLVPEERVDQVASTIVRAIERRGRHYPTSAGGRVAFFAARHWPWLVERIVARYVRGGAMARPDHWHVPAPGPSAR